MDTGIAAGELWGVVGRGLVIGLVVAVPVGPIGMLCIMRTLRFGWGAGLATGLGAATADATYAAIAAFGLATLTSALVSLQTPLTIAGSLALAIIGIRTIRAPVVAAPAADEALSHAAQQKERPSWRSLYPGTIALTLANPATILTFIGIFAGITSGTAYAPLATAGLVSAVFAGSALWWLVLSGLVSAVRRRWLAGDDAGLGTPRMRLLNALSGGVLVAFALLAAIRLLA